MPSSRASAAAISSTASPEVPALKDRAADPSELERISELIDSWATDQLVEGSAIVAVERGEPGECRWYVRLSGEAKQAFTIWFTLRQRSLFFETQVIPRPIANSEAVFEFLLRRNADVHGMAFSIGEEDGIFLQGHVPVDLVDADELDRITGSIYAYVERFFPTLIRMGFGRR